MLRRLLNASITVKMMTVLVLVIGLFLGVLFLSYLPAFERELLRDRRENMKNMVEIVSIMILSYQERATQGDLTPEEAQQRAIDSIRELRYGENGYFWINDTALPYPRMVVHPVMEGLDGQVMDDPRFNHASVLQFGLNGRVERVPGGDRNLFRALAEVTSESGAGYVTYAWPKPTPDGPTEDLYPKQSYARLFEPWGWVIGTGAYLDDIETRLAGLRRSIFIATGVILILATLVLTVFVVAFVIRPMNALTRFAERVSAGNLDAEITGRFYGETERMKTAIAGMVADLETAIAKAERLHHEARLEAERARISAGKLDALYTSMTELVLWSELVLDDSGKPVDYRIIDCNDAFVRASGVGKDAVRGKRGGEIYGSEIPPYLDTFARAVTSGRPCSFETYLGTLGIHALVSTVPLANNVFVTIMTDITDKKRAEEDKDRLQEQLLQAQTMESVGRLAGGVAHDFNNMLTVILGQAELARARADLPADTNNALLEIQKAAQHSADLTRQLLAFARKQRIAPKLLDLNDSVSGMLTMLRRLIGERIDLVWIPGAELWPVRMDPSQLHQILANLCVNGRDAIDETGKVTIETSNVVVDEDFVLRKAYMKPGEYVMLAVSDNGRGMDEETKSKLFDPFYTTKELGKGTGLGLPSVYGAVKQNEGFIDVSSVAGRGTTISIYLPRQVGQSAQSA